MYVIFIQHLYDIYACVRKKMIFYSKTFCCFNIFYDLCTKFFQNKKNLWQNNWKLRN